MDKENLMLFGTEPSVPNFYEQGAFMDTGQVFPERYISDVIGYEFSNRCSLVYRKIFKCRGLG
jgi:hypothetical protein